MAKLEFDPRLPLSDAVGQLKTRLYDLLRAIASSVNAHDDGYTHAVVSTSSSYTVQRGDGVILISAAGGARTVTLQHPSESKGKLVAIRKTEGGANNVTVSPTSGLIDGGATATLTAAAPRIMLASDGTNHYSV